MSKPTKKQLQVVVVPKIRQMLKRISVSLDEDVLGIEPTNQNVVSLLVLWLDGKSPRWLERELAPYLPALRAIEAGEASPDEEAGPGLPDQLPITHEPKPPRRRRKDGA